MKTLLICVLSAVLLGLGLGAALAYFETRPPAVPAASAQHHGPSQSARILDVPQIEIAETVFDFKTMALGETLRHDFELTNTGQAPLVMRLVSSTCQCTGVEMQGESAEVGHHISVPPAQSARITLEWVAKNSTGPFRHGARFSTNDPAQNFLRLAVQGHVLQPAEILPSSFLLGTVQAGETAEAQVYLLSYVDQELAVLDYEVSPSSLSERLDVQMDTAEPAELPDAEANSGVQITVRYRSEAVLGPLRGWLTLRTNLPQREDFTVPIVGRVTGPISIYGPGWDAKRGLLRIGPVAADQGKVVRLNMAVRGEQAQTTEFSVVRVDPPELQTRVGERRTMGKTLLHVPLVVEIPAGTRPLVRMGEPASSDAWVVLGTNHPQIEQIKIRVHFSVSR